MDSESRQKEIFNKIILRHQMHSDEACSQEYRRRFIYDYLFKGIDLAGKNVLEGMSGSGQTTRYLTCLGADVTALDISEAAIDSLRKRFPGIKTLCASICDTKLKSGSLDCVVIIGGLHHLHPRLYDAIEEIHRILKKGGYFCFSEPPQGTLMDMIRKLWYRFDRGLFEENEAAIDIDELKKRYQLRFEFIKQKYMGNIAYLLVMNSLAFRIPLSIKPFYTPLLLRMEKIFERFQGKTFSCSLLCQWRKK